MIWYNATKINILQLNLNKIIKLISFRTNHKFIFILYYQRIKYFYPYADKKKKMMY